MALIKSDAQAEAGVLPDEKFLTEMGKLNDEMMKAGVMLGGEGLQASSKGARVRMSGNKITVLDGPFAEAKELFAGYWMLNVKSKEEAVEWMKRVPTPQRTDERQRAEGEIELRQVYELSDFPTDPAEQPGGWREKEQTFREEAGPAAPVTVRKPGTKRFLVALKSNKYTESGVLPSEEMLTKMGALMDNLAKSGVLLGGEGLRPSSMGARVLFSGDKRSVVDGPFTEAKEMIAGFTMIQVKSKDDAVDFAKSWLRVHVEGTDVEGGEIEIRELFEMSDIPVKGA
jgi:hypothetical protein